MKELNMESLFNELLEASKATHVSINGKEVQMECWNIWRDFKKEKKNGPVLKAGLANHADQWKRQSKKPSKGSIMPLWKKAAANRTRKWFHVEVGQISENDRNEIKIR